MVDRSGKEDTAFPDQKRYGKGEANMKIEKVLTCPCLSGYYNKDLQAIKAGATPDGFIFSDPPMTEGFDAITQPGEALSVMLVLDDGQVAFGDCIDVIFAGAAGRDPVFKAAAQQSILKDHVTDFLLGKPIERFRELAESINEIRVNGRRLHTAVRYGVTQGILDAVAKVHHLTMAEIIAAEYGCRIAEQPIPLLACTTNHEVNNVDKMILKKVPYLPHGSSSNMARDFGQNGEKLLDYIRWLVQRINKIREPDYCPTIALDIYGILGEAFALDIPKISDFIGIMRDACLPFELVLETPLIADTRDKQIALFAALKKTLRKNSIDVKLIVDEWCNTLADVRAFAEADAADAIHVKIPDLGGINHAIEALLLCKRKGIGAYAGGTVNGTDQSARVSTHIALATQADMFLSKPGQGVDEGLMIASNEMKRTLALIRSRKQ
jgi:methylaspartate ammonia-lyase